MKNEAYNRLNGLDSGNSLFLEFREDYGLSAVEARSLIRKIERLQEENKAERGDGQILCTSLSIIEGPGSTIRDGRKVKVKLTIRGPHDLEYLRKHGSCELRKLKLQRLATEAYKQGGPLTQEKLGELLCIDRYTVGRIINEFKKEKIIIPTRGQIKDMGRGVSHKVNIVELHLKGYSLMEVVISTGHSVASVQRYIDDFSRVMILYEKGLSVNAIRSSTKLSEKLVREYIELYERFNKPDYNKRLNEIRERFSDMQFEKRGQEK